MVDVIVSMQPTVYIGTIKLYGEGISATQLTTFWGTGAAPIPCPGQQWHWPKFGCHGQGREKRGILKEAAFQRTLHCCCPAHSDPENQPPRPLIAAIQLLRAILPSLSLAAQVSPVDVPSLA